jgi:hypothetical protein
MLLKVVKCLGRPKGSTNKKPEQQIQNSNISTELAWGAKVAQDNQIATYDNKSITYKGEIKGFDYEKILREKQARIYELYALSDYFLADPLYKGIIENVFLPFSLSCGWKLSGANEKTKKKYMDFYKSIGFNDITRSIFLQMYKYENVFIYMKPNGSLMTLPVHKIRIADVTVNGEPVLELNVSELKNTSSMGGTVKENFIKTTLARYDGYPDEVKEAIKSGSGQWVQLNPINCFAIQGLKEDWVKYAVPMVASCLKAFAKKALIESYEKSQLALGMRGFLHVQVGDKENMKIVNQDALNANFEVFKNALSGLPIAVTNYMVQSAWKSVDTKSLFDKNKFAEVNSEILSAGGISAIIVSGNSDGGTSFASAQVSMQTAAQRVKQSMDNFAEMMDKINIKLAEILGVTSSKIPEFKFNEIDLTKDGKFRDACFKLWQQGVLSTRTLHEEFSIDHEQELERKKKENEDGYTEIFTLPPSFNNQNGDPDDSKSGAPTKPVSQSKQDKNNSQNAPKPSTT